MRAANSQDERKLQVDPDPAVSWKPMIILRLNVRLTLYAVANLLTVGQSIADARFSSDDLHFHHFSNRPGERHASNLAQTSFFQDGEDYPCEILLNLGEMSRR